MLKKHLLLWILLMLKTVVFDESSNGQHVFLFTVTFNQLNASFYLSTVEQMWDISECVLCEHSSSSVWALRHMTPFPFCVQRCMGESHENCQDHISVLNQRKVMNYLLHIDNEETWHGYFPLNSH